MPSNKRADHAAAKWVCLVGATGTGKTAAALALAEGFPVAVINADSRQVYRDLPVVTAQPSSAEQSRCPHRLYGFLGLEESISAGVFARMARPELEESARQGLIPVLVGGTGLYLRALAWGLAPIPAVPEDVRRDILRLCAEHGPEAMHSRLALVDPDCAARIHPRDRQRVSRALEVHAATGRPFSWWHRQQENRCGPGLTVIGLRLPRADLHARLAARIEAMLAMGSLEEMERAWARCPDEKAPGYSGIGCRELIRVLKGEEPLDQAREKWLARTRAYARRQETWFNALPGVSWLEPGDDEGLAARVRAEAAAVDR